MPLTVFVTDGDQRPALAIVRALGGRGLTVIVGEQQRDSLASRSKYCTRHVTYPSPHVDCDAFDRFLSSFLAQERVDVVMPVTDVTMHAVSRHQERLRHCSLAVPPFDAFDRVTNKARLIEHAARCGVPVPRTHVVAGRARLTSVIDAVEYPAVVKPIYSRTRTARGWVPGTAHYVRSRDELVRVYDDHEYLAFHTSLIQERIVGPAVGLFVLFERGRLVADFSHRRLREKPPAGGVSVLSESVAVDPGLRAHAIRLLGSIGWHGVAMLEYKRDRRTGNCVLIEINGRFWGSLQLAIDAGVDFPFLTYQIARGLRPRPVPPGETGVRSRWLLGDLDHLLLRLSRRRAALDLPDDAPSIGRAVFEFLKVVQPGLRYDVIRGSDWRPFAYELERYIGGLFHWVTHSRQRSHASAAAIVGASTDSAGQRAAVKA